MEQKVRIHLSVRGRVQGVFFRENTYKKAKKLGITGWVRNFPDGQVEIVAEGEKEKIEKLIEWAKRGPTFAKVDSLDIGWEEYKDEFKNFEIKGRVFN